MRARDPVALATAALMLVVTAAVAAAVPVRRAMRLEPVEVLWQL